MYFNYENLAFRYKPFPIGYAKPLMDPDVYRDLLDSYPPVEIFENLPKLGRKYSLSERFHPRQYRQWIETHPTWRDFHRWVKSDDFIAGVMEALRGRDIDLGYRGSRTFLGRAGSAIKGFLRSGGGSGSRLDRLRTRFEFSMLPADGGHILPHTDAPSKIVTLIVSMVGEGEWDPGFGGGTEVNQPRDDRLSFNYLNNQAQFEDMDVLDTFEFTSNQAVVFVKTHNSWHCVRPMKGQGSDAMRKTLTINIETG